MDLKLQRSMSGKTQYGRRWDMSVRTTNVVSNSYPTALQMMSATNAYRFRSAHFMPRIVCLKKNWRNSHFGFTKLISHSLFSLFCVNCAFISDSNFAIVTKQYAVV